MHIRKYLVTGVLVVIPIWITWLVFEFVLSQLASIGTPWVRVASRAIEYYLPALAAGMLQPWFQNTLAVVLTLLGLYLLGWIASRVIGIRLIAIFDRVMHRIPMVKKIYGSTQQLLSVLRQEPGRAQRVVLLEFPNPGMRAVGLVTRTLIDDATGEELATVYVPTTPNPTSGYLEIVPVDKLTVTDWSIDEAMTFIISGGAVAPEAFNRTRPEAGADARGATD